MKHDLQKVRQVLTDISLEPFGLDGTAADRLDTITALEADGLQLRIFSEGLNLQAKARLETEIHTKVAPFCERVMVIFGKNTAAKKAPSPAVHGATTKPFGLERNCKPIPGVRTVIAVASGKGGVGKSTVSTNLALALAQSGERVGLLDADLYGPSATKMLGLTKPLAADGGKIEPLTAQGIKVVSFGSLIGEQTPLIWRGPMVSKALLQFCNDVEWGELDYLILDLPPGTGDIQITLIENVAIDLAVVVSTPQDIALIDAHKALSMFEKLNVRVLGLVENMSVYTCPNCGHEEHLFGHEGGDRFALQRGLDVLCKVPLHPRIRSGGDQGNPIMNDKQQPLVTAEFSKLAQRVLETF